jgi:nicotinamidase-related amidase
MRVIEEPIDTTSVETWEKDMTLIVIDAQNDFITGVFGSPEAKKVADDYVIPLVKQRCRDGKKIIFTKDLHYEDTWGCNIEHKTLPKHTIYGTEGGELYGELEKCAKEHTVIYKTNFAPDVLCWGVMDDIIEMCGYVTDICVISIALQLRSLFPSHRIVIHSKACHGTTPAKHSSALEVAESCLIEVV